MAIQKQRRLGIMTSKTLACRGIYLIELCSGERQRWQYLGTSVHGEALWFDLERGREFGEGSQMYAWQIVAQENPDAKKHDDRGSA